MPTKEQIQEFLETHAPGNPKITELTYSLWLDWGDDVTMSIHYDEDNSTAVHYSKHGKNPNEALYLSVVDFADKVREFLRTP